MSLRDSLAAGKWVITAEIAPPKGTDISSFKEKALAVAKLVDGVNVTDNQRAVMRLTPLAACTLLAQWGLEPIMQITCRDRNRLALQSDLLGASVLGIINVLAMTGDHPSVGDHPQSKSVFDLDSVQLISVIKGLNDGFDMAGNALNKGTNFFIGAVAHPGADIPELQMIKLRKKVAAGAQFLQTQAIYDVEQFKEWMTEVAPLGVKVLAGIVPMKSARIAHFMNENVPGITVPDKLVERMEKAAEPVKEGIAIAQELMGQLRGVAHGVHIMAIGMEKYLPEIISGVRV